MAQTDAAPLPKHVYENANPADNSQEYVISRETLNDNTPKVRRPTKYDVNEQSLPLFQMVCEKCEEVSDKIADFVPVWDGLVGKMQDISGMRKRYILALFFCSPFFVLGLILASPILAPMLLLIYPMIMSVKAIEHKQEARTRWLIYWLFYNAITISEQFIGPFLHVMPGYAFGKGLFFVWCLVPFNENGCYYAYHIVRPLLIIPVRKIDEYIMVSINKIKNIVHDNQDLAANWTLNAATLAGNMLANKQK
ncbi:receptor expression-enhancing protein 5-like [Clytia hemisphaerica]|uniref:Receptor expression-enhancing protein n=1 Tax=Clytia hemisphaerica TaxID=252671 RepID=A0A7M5X7X1_9CNID